jgi:Ca2+-binding EF-hand superfamily protein
MITDANISCRSLQEAKQLFAELDKDKSGSIDLDEFLNLLRVSSTLNFL